MKQVSQDKKKNIHGFKMIDFLKNTNLFNINGRSTKERMGRMTFRNVSTIDYLIMSLPAYLHFQDFQVFQVNSLFSVCR